MNELELAQLFVERSQLMQRMKDIDEQITSAVLELGESRKMAGVTATYYKPSTETDYEGACAYFNVPQDAIDAHTTTIKKVSWSKVLDAMGIDAIPARFAKDKPARVVIK